jgi:hypothetical protein
VGDPIAFNVSETRPNFNNDYVPFKILGEGEFLWIYKLYQVNWIPEPY